MEFFFTRVISHAQSRMEVLSRWLPSWRPADSKENPSDVELVETIEMVPQDSMIDFYNYILGKDLGDADKGDESASVSTAATESPAGLTPSFSQVMAHIVTSTDENHESSEDEGHLTAIPPVKI